MFDRSERVTELLKQELSVLLRELKDPGIKGLLTITDLKLTRDRKSAVAFFSVMGRDEEKKSTGEALTRCVPFLRSRLRDRTSLRIIPKLVFEYDPTPERAQRIEKLLHDIEQESKGGS